MKSVRVTIVYDNRVFTSAAEGKDNNGLASGWGFSCLIQVGREPLVLFDTGRDGLGLLGNLKKLKVDASEIHHVIISHEHWDHTGGLADLLKEQKKDGVLAVATKVYIPQRVSTEFKKKIRSMGGEPVTVKSLEKIGAQVYVTGHLGGRIPEHAAVVKTSKGPLVITGCAHPSIEKMIPKIQKMLNRKKLYGVIGGLHLKDDGVSRWRRVVQAMATAQMEMVGAGHCTGDNAMRYLVKTLGSRFNPIGSGKVFFIEASQE